HPIETLEESTFQDGYGFDGSSIRGWKAINESDMLMIPDPSTAFIDPFLAHPTLVLVCDVVDTISRQPYGRDPRQIARRADRDERRRAFAAAAYCGPEADFFVFAAGRLGTGRNSVFYQRAGVGGA